MNVLGLYLGPSVSFAYSWNGTIAGCGTQGFMPDENIALHFARWCRKEQIANYDRLAVWTPLHLHPSIAPLYRWLVDNHRDKLLPISPREVREFCGLSVPTRRAYIKAARKRYRFHAKTAEESLAVSCCEVAFRKATQQNEAETLHD